MDRTDLQTTRRPRFSISEITTASASFEEDLAAYSAGGLDGIGIWESKLPAGGDARALEALEQSGLGSASAVPSIPSILPLPLLGGPTDPAERIDAICTSIHRLARFGSDGIVCLTGTGLGRDPERAREIVVGGLRTLAAEAELAGVRIAIEPYQADGGAEWTIATSIPDAVALIEDAGGQDSLGLQFDTWHLWNTPTLVEDIHREIGRIAGVHVCDTRHETRGWADRILPGQGIADLRTIIGALDEAGWEGFYDLEIFSDNGTFGTALPDSLWDVPATELAHRGRSALVAAWEGRRQTVSSVQSQPQQEGA